MSANPNPDQDRRPTTAPIRTERRRDEGDEVSFIFVGGTVCMGLTIGLGNVAATASTTVGVASAAVGAAVSGLCCVLCVGSGIASIARDRVRERRVADETVIVPAQQEMGTVAAQTVPVEVQLAEGGVANPQSARLEVDRRSITRT